MVSRCGGLLRIGGFRKPPAGQAVLRTASAAQPPGSASPNRPAGGAPVSAGIIAEAASAAAKPQKV